MHEKRVTILHVISALLMGGAEMLLVRLIPRLNAMGYRNVVLSLSGQVALDLELRQAGAEVFSGGMRLGALPRWRDIRRINAIAAAIDPGIIHGWMLHGNLAAYQISRHLDNRPPCIWAIHQTLDDRHKERMATRLMMRLAAFLSSRPRALVYVSKVSQKQHECRGFHARRAILIPNGIDMERFRADPQLGREMRSQLGIPPTARVVGHVGRFHPQKDYATLLQALAAVMAAASDVYAVIAGRDLMASNPALTELIPTSLPRQRLRLLGERRDVGDLMQAFDVLALSSAFGEAFPTVLLESMAVGVPCVVTDVGDSAALVGSTGKVVRPRDPVAFASGVVEVLSLAAAERARLGAAAAERVRASYSIESVARQYRDVYSAALSGENRCVA